MSADDNQQSAFDAVAATRRLYSPYFFAPWAAALAIKDHGIDDYRALLCNATLIEPGWALTAAYCVGRERPQSLVLLYGSEVLDKARRIEIVAIYVQPGFQDGDLAAENLALLRLATPIKALRFPRISDAQFDTVERSADARVVGWGAISEHEIANSNLLQIDTTVVATEYCNSPTVYAGKVTPQMLCATSKYPGVDVCQGFGGSGLITQAGSEPELIGVVGWGEKCGRPNMPTVYFRTGLHASWIRSVIEAP